MTGSETHYPATKQTPHALHAHTRRPRGQHVGALVPERGKRRLQTRKGTSEIILGPRHNKYPSAWPPNTRTQHQQHPAANGNDIPGPASRRTRIAVADVSGNNLNVAGGRGGELERERVRLVGVVHVGDVVGRDLEPGRRIRGRRQNGTGVLSRPRESAVEGEKINGKANTLQAAIKQPALGTTGGQRQPPRKERRSTLEINNKRGGAKGARGDIDSSARSPRRGRKRCLRETRCSACWSARSA